MFQKVAEAEAKVHGKSLYEVHFHEVGAVDSIVDIVGAAICLDYLNVDKIMCSTVELGGGFVKCAHGIIPVPAPATVEILKGVPVKSGAVLYETTTPTGAAILAANVSEFTDNKEFTIKQIGYGIGNRDTEIPNVLRVFLATQKNSDSYKVDNKYIIECNIDDMNPEFYGYIMEKLLNCGVSDVFLTNIIIKKGRPGIKLNVLCSKKLENQVKEILFTETSTLGIRKYEVNKNMLKREICEIKTDLGNVRIKKAYLDDKVLKCKFEYEDIKKLSIENNIPLIEVNNRLNNATLADENNC